MRFLVLFFFLLFSFSFGYSELTFAVLSSGSPVKEYKRFKALTKYIESKVGIPVKLKIVNK